MGAGDAAQRLFDNLLNIEVNTLVKPGMTGRKMPAVGQAILDIFGEYDIWLCECSGRINPLWTLFRKSPAARAYKERLAAVDELSRSKVFDADGHLKRDLPVATFDESKPLGAAEYGVLRDHAATALEMHRVLTGAGLTRTEVGRTEVLLGGGDAVMLRRIVRNCDQLQPILERIGPAVALSRAPSSGIQSGAREDDFSGSDMLTIRKAWELQTEVIVMQTVVQLDGDAVTRLNDLHRSAEQEHLRDIHRDGVDTALRQWDALVRTLVTIFDKLSGYLR